MSRFNSALKLIGVGWYVGLCIVLGVALGIWADRKFHTEPLLTIVGLIVGIVVAFYGMYRMLASLFAGNGKGTKNKENGG